MLILQCFLKVVYDLCIAVAACYATKLLDEWLEEDEKSE